MIKFIVGIVAGMLLSTILYASNSEEELYIIECEKVNRVEVVCTLNNDKEYVSRMTIHNNEARQMYDRVNRVTYRF